MATPFELLTQALNNNTLPSEEAGINTRMGSTPETKQSIVATKAEEKKQGLLGANGQEDFYQSAVNRGTERGTSSMSDLERDLNYLSPSEILQRHGREAGTQILQVREASQNQYYQDETRQYDSDMEPLGDAITNIGLGVATGIGGPGAFAAGLIDDEAGAVLSRGLERANELTEGVQSERADAGRRITEARMSAELRDSADRARREQEQIDFNRANTPDAQRESSFTEEREDFQTSVRQIGRDILSGAGIATENSAYLAQGTAQGVGSIVSAGILGKAIGAGAAALVPASTQRGVQVAAAIDRANNTRSLARGVDAVGRGSSVPLAIGAMEGGGAYADVSNQIQNMSFEELESNSPNYRELINEGLSPEDARTRLANDAGIRAGSVVAPLAAATGTLVSRFEGNPLDSGSARAALSNILVREPLEEGIQGGMSGLASNEAIQTYADENRDMTENVGRQIGEGAVLGLTSAGALQTPSLVANTVRETLGSDVNIKRFTDFTGSIIERADKVREANEAASPIADNKVAQAAQVATENAEVAATAMREGIESSDVTSEDKAVANNYVDNLLGSLNVDPSAVQDPSVPQSIRDAVGDKTNRVEAIQALAERIEASETDQEQIELGLALLNYMEPVIEISQTDPVAFEDLADDHPAIQALMTYKALLANVTRSPKVDRALQTADNLLAQAAENTEVDINEQTVNTPEGQRQVEVATAVSTRHPDQANLETNEKILFQAQQGNLQLSDKQRVALESSVNLLRSARAYQEQAAAMGHPNVSDVVSRQITTDRVNNQAIKQSALGFTQQIVGAMRQNDPVIAQARLEELGMFAQHMQNKVAAYNQNFASGTPNENTKYEALMPDRSWKESAKGVFVQPTKANSLRLAQTVALEAQMLNDVYKGLRQAFPDLAVPEVNTVFLDQQLMGNPTELAQRFSSPQATQAPVVEPTNEVVQEAVEIPETNVPAVDTVPSVASIQAMDDATLNEQLGTMQELNQGNNSTAFTREYFNRLDAEMNTREEAAIQTNIVEEAELAETSVDNTVDEVDNSAVVDETTDETVVEEDLTYTTLTNREADLEAQLEDDQLTDSEARVLREQLSAVKRELSVLEGEVTEELTERTMAAQFSNLVDGGGMVNMFKTAFTIPKQLRTRTSVDTDVIQTITEAVSNPLAMAALVGEKTGNRLSESAGREYSAYLSNAQRIREAMDTRLETVLGKKGESLRSRQERAARYADTMLFNIVEPTDEGFIYNQNLADNAVLAGMQWILEADKYGSVITDEDIRSITGRDPILVQPHIIDAITNGGMSSADIKRSMADKIVKYWGVQANHNESLSYTQGIPEQMAAEVIESMIDLGMIEVTETDISENLDGTKTLKQYKPIVVSDDSALRSFPTAIENAVLIEPEEINYIGDDVTIPVARTQMRNRLANNTKQQREAIERKQQVPFYIDTTMLNLVISLGEGNLVDLFGNGSLIDERKINKIHLQSLEGQNRTLTAAIEATNALVTEVKRKAELANVSLDQMPIRYAFNFSSVGRLHMLGKHNPQASKYSRELILPNQATLDLSSENNDDMRKFGLGMAQALGIKVHNMPWNTAQTKLQSKLENELAPALNVLGNWLDNTDTSQVENVFTLPAQELAKLKASLGAGNAKSMVGLHALVEYARYQRSEDPSQFRTSLYLEADGVTNGVVNALNLLVSGSFTQAWKDNVARGGLYFNTVRSLNEHRSEHDANDLYKVSSDYFSEALRKQSKNFANNEQVSTQINHVMTVMESLLKDITVNDDGNLVLDRGVTKNPLTITLYGSGAEGIAGNFVGALTESLYERMTEAANSNANTVAEALFPDAANAQVKFNAFQKSMNELINKKALVVKGELVISKNGTSNKDLGDYENFEFTTDELNNLQTNLHRMFVEPLRVAITQTVGVELMTNAELLRISSQVQSIYESQMFQKEINKKREELVNEGTRTKSEYLSRNELDEITKSLENVSPRLNTGNQILSISGSAKAEDPSYNNFSSSLTGTLRTGPFINGPKDAGVRGIPLTVIGSGDGMMMQYITLEQLEGTLEIFDGMHMPLDKIDEYSRIANEAVYKTWQGNPLRALQTSYESFLENAEFTQLNQEELDAISKAIVGNDGVGSDQNTVVSLVQSLLPKLKNAADSIEARHRTVDSMKVSIDQMAAAASPYENEGDSFDTLMTDEALLAEMNLRYEENLNTIQKQETTTIDPAKIGVATISGAFTLSGKNFRNLNKLAKLTPEQASLHRELVRSKKADDYTIVMGTAEQIQDYQESVGRSEVSGSAIKRNAVSGFITPENKTIYVVNGSVETILHEMVHAATFETIQNYYNSENLGNNATEISEAIQRIEQLKKSFMSLERSVMTEAQSIAYDRATAAIAAAESNLDLTTETANAIALNEFMAWSLANAELSSALKKTKTPKLIQLARDVVDKIKEVIWGKGKTPELAANMFSSLQFNTAIVMSAQPSLSQRQRSSVLFQSNTYGTSDRLNEINTTFAKTISDFITESTGVNESKALQQKRDAAIAAATLASRVQANGYPMTKQEETTFQQVVAAMSMETSLDANVMNEAQKLYTHVAKNMDLGFISDPSFSQDVRLDANQRSALLPVFLGLALTNDKFRDQLRRVALPKTQRNRNDSLDNVLSNTAQGVMDQLSVRLSGQNKNSDVQAAIDALANKLQRTVKDRETYIDQMSDGVTGLADRSNQLVIDGMTALSDKMYRFSKTVQADPERNKYEKMLARSAELMSSLANQEKAEAVSESVVADINNVNGFEPLRALLSDITGRTESNASVYDLIKPVRAQIQRIRQNFRKDVPVIIGKKFKTELKKEQWAMMTRGMANTDLAALVDTFSRTEVLELLGDESSRQNAIEELQAAIKTADPANATLINQKSMQLAHYMNTGEPGKNLLRNSNAIAALLNETTTIGPVNSNDVIRAVDQLVTLYAINGLAQTDKDSLGLLAQTESKGMDFTLAYLVGQRKEELAKAQTGRARFNHYKGYIRQNAQAGVSMMVAEDTQFARLKGLGYERVGNYVGSSSERSTVPRGYYYMPVSSRAAFSQGIFQNAHKTAYGVNAHTGYSESMTAGTITDKATVKQITRRLQRETATNEALMAVFDETGQVVGYERVVDATVTRPALNQETHLGDLIGEWRGRQVEEAKSQIFNEATVDRLKQMYDEHRNTGRNPNEYVNLFDEAYLKNNPVIADAVSLLTGDTTDYIQEVFEDGFYVRKDMLKDAIGYRNASIGDAWTGNTNWSPEVQKTVRNLAVTTFGNKAYRYLVNTENTIENIMGEVRTTIVVRSVIIPVVNFMSNAFQLISAGVPIKNITTELPKKLAEIHSYTESYSRMTEAQAELLAASENSALSRKLQAEIQSIEDSHRRLSIWPLLEGGEFSTVADIGRVVEDTSLTTGKLGEYIENLADKMPPGLRTAARYGIVSKDTALYQGLQKSVLYGDFISKAVLYDDLVKRQRKSKKEALAQITEEFVNYDVLPGRFRGKLENIGLLWFYNFKIRSAKVAASRMRNNPVHTLMAMTLPGRDLFGTAGLPIEDNVFTKAAEGSLGYSMGPGMAGSAIGLNPWVNLAQ